MDGIPTELGDITHSFATCAPDDPTLLTVIRSVSSTHTCKPILICTEFNTNQMFLLNLGKLSFSGWPLPPPSTRTTHNTAQAQKLAFGDDSPSDGEATILENQWETMHLDIAGHLDSHCPAGCLRTKRKMTGEL